MKKFFATLTMTIIPLATNAQDGKYHVISDTTQSITSNIQSLADVDVVMRIEKTKLNGNVMVTRIVGSPLSNAGTAADALARVPGLFRRNGEIEVIGKGAPIYYINGRKVTDLTELQRLSSQEIKEVEVINTPGAQYDAQVNAVVRIKTVKRLGEGISGSIDARNNYGLAYGNNRLNTTAALSYRHKAIELFGGATFYNESLQAYKNKFHQTTIATQQIDQDGKSNMTQHYKGINYHLGADWQVAENHSIGFKVERNDNLHGRTDYYMNSEVIANNETLIDKLYSNTHTLANGVDSWAANTYYAGKIGKLEISWNNDYYHTQEQNEAVTHEQALSGNREVNTQGISKNKLFASKVTFSYPTKQGKLQAGAEVDVVDRNNTYTIDQQQITDDRSKVNENTYALFAEYNTMLPFGMLNLGLRFEHVDFDYKSIIDASQNIARHQNHIYPTLSFATQIKEWQASVSYGVKTRRPNYRDLRSNVEYNNRYTLSTGNPKLKNEVNHQAAINMRWRMISILLNYQNQQNGIYDWTHPYGEDGTVLFSWINLDKPIHSAGIFVNLTNTWGKWTPSYTIAEQKQWLKFDLNDPRANNQLRTVTYNKPMFIFNANNAWKFPSKKGVGACQLELNSEFLSGFHWGNAEITNCYWNLMCAIQKSWFENDALSVRLVLNDIFQTAHHDARIDLGNYIMTQTHINGVNRSIYDPQTITLSVRYKFNHVKSRYRGTGAGHDIKSRM
ncbi:MAG: outer membrane beta-barrel family protein [Bacteroidales bacterium]|nr:outer membrane beta-barrel family protein [Bacteroidales bacterium]